MTAAVAAPRMITAFPTSQTSSEHVYGSLAEELARILAVVGASEFLQEAVVPARAGSLQVRANLP